MARYKKRIPTFAAESKAMKDYRRIAGYVYFAWAVLTVFAILLQLTKRDAPVISGWLYTLIGIFFLPFTFCDLVLKNTDLGSALFNSQKTKSVKRTVLTAAVLTVNVVLLIMGAKNLNVTDTVRGITLSYHRLIGVTVLFTTVMVFVAYVVIAYTVSALKGVDKKRLERLRESKVQHRIKEYEKAKRKLVRELIEIIGFVLLFALLISLATTKLIFPALSDYVSKDYVVYQGSIEVTTGGRHSHVMLEDGTKITGTADLDDSDTYGTVIYSKKSKMILGGISEPAD